MNRINVIGTTGSGKSTFSAQLAEALGHPCIQMDELFWKPNWTESKDDEFLPKVSAALKGDVWVLDGNFSRTSTIKFERADTIIWLDYSYSRTLFQLLGRTVRRALFRQELWPNTGNRESFYKSFMTRDSILIWFFRFYKQNRIKYLRLMDAPEYRHIRFVHLRSPKERGDFLEGIGR
jgi:adenylate kinase family enzyme